jgi:hypothetical protein
MPSSGLKRSTDKGVEEHPWQPLLNPLGGRIEGLAEVLRYKNSLIHIYVTVRG